MASSVDISSICPQKTLCVIPFQKHSGSVNMALDYNYAQNMAANDDPILRFYGWEPVCLSLGYHQDASEVDLTQLAKNHVDIVRRPTGGSAILHAKELTYSLIVADGNSRHHTIYAAFHQLLASALRDLGYQVQLHQEKLHENYLAQGRKTFACFNRPAFAEIKYEHKKVVGSAQKLFPNCLLQHGSILLDANQVRVLDYLYLDSKSKMEQADALRHSSTGLKEINSRDITETSLSESIIEQFAENGVKSIYFREPKEQELDEVRKNLQMFDVDG